VRPFLIYLHRYVGLLLAPFLVIVGLTGSALAFYHELDRWLNPSMLTVPIPQTLDQASLFDPFALHERTESQEPRAQIDWFDLTFEPGQAYRLFLLPELIQRPGKALKFPTTSFILILITVNRPVRVLGEKYRLPKKISCRFCIGCITPWHFLNISLCTGLLYWAW